ncbi:unnamed protein product [Pleuronectes platessa]|uniref:Uncharacterized protein n=1 Tax=Pleuronectes platessa TaxID=8262 RepID=A0A9N7U703_PLEPL|nr:unnamed protein product [Pleuronectes platessa]
MRPPHRERTAEALHTGNDAAPVVSCREDLEFPVVTTSSENNPNVCPTPCHHSKATCQSVIVCACARARVTVSHRSFQPPSSPQDTLSSCQCHPRLWQLVCIRCINIPEILKVGRDCAVMVNPMDEIRGQEFELWLVDLDVASRSPDTLS